MKIFSLMFLVLMLAVGVSCSRDEGVMEREEDTVERMGEDFEDGVDEAGDNIEDAAEELDD